MAGDQTRGAGAPGDESELIGMKVTQKKTAEGTIRLEAIATAAEVNNALQAASVAFAQSMGLAPMPNKTVAQVAEERMGIKNLDSLVEGSAIETLVPLALDRKGIVPAYPPKAQPTSPFKRDRQFSFQLDVQPKTAYELSSYEPVEITVPAFQLDETLVDKQIEEVAKSYTAYVAVDPKPLEKGDSCALSMECYEKGELLKGLSTDNRTYTAGEGYMPEGFDAGIYGMMPGETRSFTFEGPSFDDDFNETVQVVDCTVTLKEIQKATTPVIDDEWIKTNMPMYKDYADFRGEIRRNLERQVGEEYESYKMQAAVSQLARRFQGSIADEVYEAMRDSLVGNLRNQLRQQGKSWEDFVSENGGEQQFGMMLMMQTRETLVQGFALDAVFRHEHLRITDEDIEAVCRSMNPNVPPKRMREQVEQSGHGFALRESAERMKANKWVLEHAIVHVEKAPEPELEAAAPEVEPAPEAAPEPEAAE